MIWPAGEKTMNGYNAAIKSPLKTMRGKTKMKKLIIIVAILAITAGTTMAATPPTLDVMVSNHNRLIEKRARLIAEYQLNELLIQESAKAIKAKKAEEEKTKKAKEPKAEEPNSLMKKIFKGKKDK
jgi:hypothetical protein